MPDNIEDLFNEAIQADEAGSENESEEKEEATTEEEQDNSKETHNEEEEKSEDKEEKEENEEESEESEDAEDIDDPQLILQRYKTLQGMYRSQKQKLEELSKGEKTQSKEEPEKEETQSQEEQNPENQSVDTSWVSEALNSNEEVKEFAEEFPEIHAVLENSLKSVMERYTQAMSQAFQTLLQQIDQKYQPIASSVTKITAKEKDKAIEEHHPDYSTLKQSQELKDWIDSQPKTLKKAYTEILEDGTAEDMIELLNDFKLKTGIKTPQESPPKKKPKVAPSTKNKAPSSKPPVDMDDFEQAFYEAIKEGD